ncbi:hypothetical protein [Vibrio coralliilyticus]|nr:hypothetical protein [Vibrio coralliilyticus]
MVLALLTSTNSLDQSYIEQRYVKLMNNQVQLQLLEVPFAYETLP